MKLLVLKLLKPQYFIGILTIAGAVLRFYHLDHNPLWFDEAVIYWIANGDSIGEIVQQNGVQNSAPPLFVLLTSLALEAGNTEFHLRLLPWIGGILSIPAIYLLSRCFIQQYPAFLVSAFVAVAPTQILYSQELREYSLTFLVSTIILWLFLRYLRDSSIQNIIFLTLSMAIGVFLQYGLSVLIISLNLIFLMRLVTNKDKNIPQLMKWVVSQCIILIVALYIASIALQHQMASGHGANEISTYLSHAYWDGTLFSFLRLVSLNSFSLILFAFPGYIFPILALSGFIFTMLFQKEKIKQISLLLVPTGMTFLLALARLYPYHGQRHCMFLMPMIYVLFGLGIDRIFELRNQKVSLLIIAICLVSISHGLSIAHVQLQNPGMQHLLKTSVEALKRAYQDDEMIYVYYGAKPAFQYYYPDQPSSSIIFGSKSREDSRIYLEEVDQVLDMKKPVWLVFSHCVYKNECEQIVNYVQDFCHMEILVYDSRNPYLVYASP